MGTIGVKSNALEGCMVEIKTIQPTKSYTSFPLDSFTFILCKNGKLNISYDNVQYLMNTDNIFICLPDNHISVCSETDTRICCLSVNQDFLRRNYLLQRILMPYLLQIKQTPLLQMPEIEIHKIQSMMQCVEWNLSKDSLSECIYEAAIASVKMTLYNICQHIKSVGNKCTSAFNKREDELYTLFMKEVLLHYKKERRLEFYASKLYISPKYLGTVLKNRTGKKATELINSVLIEDIKYQLRYTNEPIKVICDNFNFPNPSFFGKFFKNMVGLSPMEYRNSLNNT